MSLLDVFRAPPTEIPVPLVAGQAAIVAEGIWVELGGQPVLRDVDLPVVAGQVR